MARKVQEREIEVLAEADRLEPFPHPRETQTLFGHDHQERELVEAFDAGRMHHGWILAGPPGIGKASLAYRLAAFALAEPDQRLGIERGALRVEPNCTADRQVRALSHPRLLVLRRPYDLKAKRFLTSIPIDAVRSVRGFLSSRGDHGAWRVVIVDSADELNVNAANALLKSLEEPPPRTLFLLVSSEPGRLLKTIRSRCRVLSFAPLTEEHLRQAVAQAVAAAQAPGIDDAAFQSLAALARGSVRRLLSLHALKGAELAAAARDILAKLPDVDWSKVHRLSDELAPIAALERYEVFFDCLSRDLHDGVRRAIGAAAADPAGGGAPERFVSMVCDQGRLADWAGLYAGLHEAKAEAEGLNLDRKGFLMETVSRLAQVAGAR